MWLPQQSRPEWLESVDRSHRARAGPRIALLARDLSERAAAGGDGTGAMVARARRRRREVHLQGMERLDAAGYTQYEISNVAHQGRESRHNLKCWTDGEWLGFGCGAHSTRNGVREKNLSSTEEYIAVAEKGQLAGDRRVLSRGSESRGPVHGTTAVARHRPDRGQIAVWRRCSSRFGSDLEPFVEGGLLIYDGGRMHLTRAGMLLAHEVMTVFINSFYC